MNNKRIVVEDLISKLNEDLIGLVDKYKIGRGARFNTFVHHAIRYKLIAYLNYGWQTVRIPKSRWDKYRNTFRDMTVNEYFVTIGDIVEDMNMPVERGYEMVEMDVDTELMLRDYFSTSVAQIEADIVLLRFYCGGKEFSTWKHIATALDLPSFTIRSHWNSLYKKHNLFFNELNKIVRDGSS